MHTTLLTQIYLVKFKHPINHFYIIFVPKSLNVKHLLFSLLIISIISCRKDPQPNTPNVNRGKVSFTTDTISVLEKDTILFIPVQLTQKRDKDVTVYFHIEGNSATPEYDYFVSNGSLHFPKGEDTVGSLIIVDIFADTLTEIDETFTIFLDSATNAIISQKELTLKILDDESRRATYPGYSTPLFHDGYTMVWQDEFLGTELNETDWNYRIGNGCPNLCGFGNNELQYYRKQNAIVANDLLTITAKKETFASNQYTSTRINTFGKISVPYGRIDVRARLPFGKGIWPAIWMMGNNKSAVGWPACGEIDMMELRGSAPNKANGTIHYKNASGVHQYPPSKNHILSSGTYHDEFHVFSLVRTEGKIQWYVDDILFNTKFYSQLNLGSQPNPFLQDFYIILNLAVGGNYDGNPNSSTIFPQTMEIDYVRVFEKN